ICEVFKTSEVFLRGGLPARLLYSRDETVAGHVAEANAADAELAINRAGPATYLAAALDADPLARQHLDFVGGPPAGLQFLQLSPVLDVLCFGRHSLGHFLSLWAPSIDVALIALILPRLPRARRRREGIPGPRSRS